jgi:Zn-dependent protease with chaperone function
MKPLNLTVIGLALGLFSAITFTLCILWDVAVPAYSMTRLWELLLPGFRGISPASYLLGLIGSFLYGLYAAVVFVPLYNWLSRRIEARQATGGMRHA